MAKSKSRRGCGRGIGPIDVHVGARVRQRRTLLGMTHTKSGSMTRYEGFTEESEAVSLLCHDSRRGEAWHGLRHI